MEPGQVELRPGQNQTLPDYIFGRGSFKGFLRRDAGSTWKVAFPASYAPSALKCPGKRDCHYGFKALRASFFLRLT